MIYAKKSSSIHAKETKLSTKKKGNYIMKKETWKTILQIVVSVITAIATTLGVTSCTI